MATVFRQRVPWRSLALIASETVLIVFAISSATYILTPGGGLAPGELARALMIVAVCQLCLYFAELYDFRILAERRETFVRLLHALGAASVILAVIYLFFPDLVIARGVFAITAFLLIAFVGGWRWVFERVTRHLGHRERLLLVGTSPAAVSLARELHERRELGVQIVGFVDPDPSRIGMPVFNPGIVGTLEDIPRITREQSVDRVVVSLADARGRLPMDKLLEMKLDGVAFAHLATVYEEYTGKISVENLRPSWLIFSRGFRKSRLLQAVKRTMDMAGAAAGILLTLPIMLGAAAAVRLTSPGPVLYQQQRVGQHGRAFILYKFRSMRAGAERETGPVWAARDDDRITPVGRFIRRTRIDELPQLWNVLRGDMSLVGPRPERPEFVQALMREIPFYGQRHVVKPGLTGWAQVRYAYGNSVEDAMEKLQYDLFYIKNMSFGLDVFIVFKTIQTVVLQRGT
ncbi:MAG TPA: TIGR03013 family XrtA/PEP-CTERM system glycosyltransferase [Vicinamibacterales bacterium]|nr:TIGR03013 family XrtA/PEP-CTERM system glycosyltransferase [Vicinamibacterales bacterium]